MANAPNARAVQDLLRRFLLSPTIERVLIRCAGEAEGRLIGIGDFIGHAARAESGSAGSVLRKGLPASAIPKEKLILSKESNFHRIGTSPGLWNAFTDAAALRREGGGRDEYLGLRHVLFSIFSLQVGEIAEERQSFCERHGIDPKRVANAIAMFIVEAKEPEEKGAFWAETLLHRGFIYESALLEKAKGALGPQEVAGSDQERSPKEAVKPDADAIPDPIDMTPRFVVCQADDPWEAKLRDHFGVQQEAAAFGAMVTAREFKPPLAVGVFGEWGSGKSFFLRLVDEEIRARCEAAGQMQPGADGQPLQHIVQIRFNAWHYAETNLWASLIDHIFTCLDQWTRRHKSAGEAEQLFEHLATARRLTLESAGELVVRRREQLAAEEQHAEAQQALATAREEAQLSPMAVAKAVWDSFKGDHEAEINQLIAESGLPELKESAASFQSTVQQLDNELGRFALARGVVLRRLGSNHMPWIAAGMVLVLPPILAMVLGGISGRVLNEAASIAAATAATLAGLIAPLVLVIGRVTQIASETLGKLRALRLRYTEQLEASLREEKQRQDAAAEKLMALQMRANEAADRLRLATEQAVDAAREHNSQTGRGRVLRFVRERVAEGTYAKHLGFVATVRKDFEQLSELMAPIDARTATVVTRAHAEYQKKLQQLFDTAGGLLKEPERRALEGLAKLPEDLPVFERIVLYIDDLDRCPPQQVVQVLQAIHLLLTFPLFVVFVAVDVRWLQQSLETHYKGQFGTGASDSGPGFRRPLASDYLEKIFQVPYWVRPTTPDKVWSMLEDRLGPQELELPQLQAPVLPQGDVEDDGVAAPTAGEESVSVPPSAPQSQPAARMLAVGRAEREFLKALSPCLEESPRRLLRFINTYRLIKGSLAPRERRVLEDRDHRLLMALLAVNIVAERAFVSLSGTLLQDKVKREELDAAIEGSGSSAADIRRAQKILRLPRSADYRQSSLKSLVMLVSRYGFEHHIE